MRSRRCRWNALAAAVLLTAAMGAWPRAAAADSVQDFLATLGPAQQNEFIAWRTAKNQHDRMLDAYWQDIEKKRAGRRLKRGNTKFFDTDDYVWTFPPTYKGPRLSAASARRRKACSVNWEWGRALVSCIVTILLDSKTGIAS